jgi:hypothetical protein
MHEDRTLFGKGPYPDTGPLAVLARLAFLLTALGVAAAVIFTPSTMPKVLRSHYLEHFAAFYVVTLAALAAMSRARLRRVAMGMGFFAAVLESTHYMTGGPFGPVLDNWVADAGGVAAAVAPVLVERFRRRFPPRPPRG